MRRIALAMVPWIVLVLSAGFAAADDSPLPPFLPSCDLLEIGSAHGPLVAGVYELLCSVTEDPNPVGMTEDDPRQDSTDSSVPARESLSRPGNSELSDTLTQERPTLEAPAARFDQGSSAPQAPRRIKRPSSSPVPRR